MGEFFDPLSFVLGIGTAGALGGGAYLLRNRVSFARKETREGETDSAGGARELVAPQAGRRYLEAIGKFFDSHHLPGKEVALRDVLIEPQFLRAKLPKLNLDDDEDNIAETDIYRVIPFIHHSPAVYASFNLETMRLQDLETGNRQIAILGIEGSGKSTTLMALGLLAAGRLTYDALRKEEDIKFEADKVDPDLPDEVRELRQKEREEVQRRAIEQLRIIQHREEEAEALEALDLAVDFRKMLPLYAHVRDLDLDPASYGGSIDPVEPIVRALSNYVDRVTAQVAPPLLYRMLNNNKAMILIDGYDELLPSERDLYYHWLESLVTYYGGNFIFITGPARGYDPLIQAGFAPAIVRPFTERRFARFIDKWLANWRGTLPSETERQRLFVDNRNRTIMDVCIKVLATLGNDLKETGRRGYYDYYVRQRVDAEIPHGQDILKAVAAHWLDTGKPATTEELKSIAATFLGAEKSEEDRGEKKAKKNGVPASNIDRELKKLLQSPLVREHPDGSVSIRHPILAWYLAGETLRDADTKRLMDMATSPNWHGALTFATAIVDLEPTILKKLGDKFDLLFTNLFSVADWMPDAPGNLRWKGEIIKRLGAALMSTTQFPTVREHALAAMVACRDDTGGILYLLRQAVRSGNPHIRTLGCLGLGAVGAEGAIGDLSSMLQDNVVDVQLAAGLGLGAIATEEALTPLVEALLTGQPALRQAVAEAMASMPGEGHEILHDGITHEDLEVRRACAFGLARIPTTWALVALYRAMLEDSQWYVRSAAERAFAQAREPKAAGPQRHIEPTYYRWLESWAAGRGEAIPEGPSGRQVLMRALQEGPQQIRAESARALGYLAHLPALKALYAALGDREQTVRAAAFDALSNMSARYGKPLPGI